MLVTLLILALFATAFALWKARRDYRVHGKQTWLGLLALCVMLFVPNLMLHYASSYRMTAVGVVVAAVGLTVCLAGMVTFRSVSKVLCLDPGTLAVTGVYRWSRNPQYVGWLMFLIGFALNDRSWWCATALAIVAISLQLLVLIEEEHLTRVFGERYREFVDKTPRYLGFAFGKPKD